MRVDPVGSSKGLGETSISKVISEELRVSTRKAGDVVKEEAPRDMTNVISDFKKKVEKFHEIVKSELRFEIDRDINMIIVKIKDKDTGEIIRQIPPEVVVKLAKAIEEFLGLILDERV